MVPRIDLTAQKFGRWMVTGPDAFKAGAMHWHCRCDCGTERVVNGAHLRNGKTTSCGCYKAEAKVTHGLSGHPMYRTWAGVLSRCRDPKNAWYHRYGGRGITVCERWLDFANFFADIGERPEGMTLDRIDNDGNYEPSNVRWATHKQQAETATRGFRTILVNGEALTITEWSRRLGVHPNVIHTRLHRGWPEEDAVTTPYNIRR
jgi:hypothetical protein